MSLNKKQLTRDTRFANMPRRTVASISETVPVIGPRFTGFQNPYSNLGSFHRGGIVGAVPAGHAHDPDGNHPYGYETELNTLTPMYDNWAKTRYVRNADGDLVPAADQRLHPYKKTVYQDEFGLTDLMKHTKLTGDLDEDLGRIGTMSGRTYFDQTGDELEYITDDQGNFTGEISYNPSGPNAEFIAEQINEYGYVPKPYVAEQKAVEVNATRSGRDKFRKLWTEVKAAARTAKDLGIFKNAYGEDRVPLPRDFTTESLEKFKEDVGFHIKKHKRNIIQERQYKELSKQKEKGKISNYDYIQEIKRKGLEKFTPGYYEVDKEEFYDAMNEDFADKTESFKTATRLVTAPVDAAIRIASDPGGATDSILQTTVDAGKAAIGGGWAWGDDSSWYDSDRQMWDNTGGMYDLFDVVGAVGGANKLAGFNMPGRFIGKYNQLAQKTWTPKGWHNARFSNTKLGDRIFNTNRFVSPEAAYHRAFNFGNKYNKTRLGSKFGFNADKFGNRVANTFDKTIGAVDRLPGVFAKNANLENLASATHIGAEIDLARNAIGPDADGLDYALLGYNSWGTLMPFYTGYNRYRHRKQNPMEGQFPEFEHLQQASDYRNRRFEFSPRSTGIYTDHGRFSRGNFSNEEITDLVDLSSRLSGNRMYRQQFKSKFGRNPTERELMEFGYIQEARKRGAGQEFPMGARVEIAKGGVDDVNIYTGEIRQDPYKRHNTYMSDIELPAGTLPAETNAAMSVYQGSRYGAGFQGSDPYANWLNERISPAFQMRTKEPQTLMRAYSGNPNATSQQFMVTRGGKDIGSVTGIENLQVGDEIKFGDFGDRITSTAIPPTHYSQLHKIGDEHERFKNASYFSFGNNAMSIDVPAGTRGASFNNMGSVFDEKEFLLPKTSRFQVIGEPDISGTFRSKLDAGIVNARPNLQLRLIAQRFGGAHRMPVTRQMFKRF